MPESGGLLRDQQTLNETTVRHGHLLLGGKALAGGAFGRSGAGTFAATPLLVERRHSKQLESITAG